MKLNISTLSLDAFEMSFIGPLSFIWLLSISFYKFSIIGSLSFDNLFAPMLLLMVLIAVFSGSIKYTRLQYRNIFWAIVSMLAYVLSHSINLINTQSAVWSSLDTISKGMLYFILPILFITNEKQLKVTNNAIIIIMFIGSFTALLQSLGAIQLNFARHTVSRFGLEGLEKSVGFFANYGDMAILTSISLLLVIGGRNGRILFGKGSWLKILFVVIAVMAGIIAQQSRNLIFTILVCVIVFIFLGYIRRSPLWRRNFYFFLIMGISVSSIMVLFNSDTIIAWIQSVGGTKEAAATVTARLSQYKYGWSVVHDHLLFGADPKVIQRHLELISFIHNMWLKELVEGGIPAILATLLFYIRAIRNQVSRYHVASDRFEARAYLAMLVGLLIATQFYPASTYIYWTLLGVATARPANNPLGNTNNNMGRGIEREHKSYAGTIDGLRS